MGAGKPANTGEAGAMHRVAFFAGMPAPTDGLLADSTQ
ncbi:diguanylate cyclase [Pseudomonas plecoglossicida]|uniref:Diguanylate cyclase n=1 Tax=Pseudomonas plecoglossicida TaxID=70775 RepID=A0A2R7UDW2_PSEDL|nr:diguanylate cyclase [Pseudomonas plecoglossicida]RFQ06074.1 diguanylate cyclase [Pseudomonas putida]